MSGGRSGDCDYCPGCGNFRGTSQEGYTEKAIVDERTGRTVKVVKYKKMKCSVCKCKWLEKLEEY